MRGTTLGVYVLHMNSRKIAFKTPVVAAIRVYYIKKKRSYILQSDSFFSVRKLIQCFFEKFSKLYCIVVSVVCILLHSSYDVVSRTLYIGTYTFRTESSIFY